jgi:hypothetical protein
MGILDQYFSIDAKRKRYEYADQTDEPDEEEVKERSKERSKKKSSILDQYFFAPSKPESQPAGTSPAKPEISAGEPPWMEKEIARRGGSEFETRQRGIREAKRAAFGQPQPSEMEMSPGVGERVLGVAETPIQSMATFTGALYRSSGEFAKDVDFATSLISHLTEPLAMTPAEDVIFEIAKQHSTLKNRGLPEKLIETIAAKGILYKTGERMEEFGEYLTEGGLPPGLAREIVDGFGGAAFEVPKLMALASFLGLGTLPVSGGVKGARIAREEGGDLDYILKAGVAGSVGGALMRGMLGALGRLPNFLSRVVAGGVFYATTPGTQEEKISSALTMAALAGGGGTWREFLSRYGRQPNVEEMLQRSRELTRAEKTERARLKKEASKVIDKESSLWEEMRPAYRGEDGKIISGKKKGGHKLILPYDTGSESGAIQYQTDVKAGRIGWLTPGGKYFNVKDLVENGGDIEAMMKRFNKLGDPGNVVALPVEPTAPVEVKRADLFRPGATVYFEVRTKNGTPARNRKWVKGKVINRALDGDSYRYQIKSEKYPIQVRSEGDGWKYVNEDFRIRRQSKVTAVGVSKEERQEYERREVKKRKLIDTADQYAGNFFSDVELKEWADYIESQRHVSGGRRDRAHLAVEEYRNEMWRRLKERYGNDVDQVDGAMVSDLDRGVIKAAKGINEFVEDFSPNIGLSVKFRDKRSGGEINYPDNRGAEYWLRAINDKVEGRYQAARGATKEPIFQKVKRIIIETGLQFTRKYPSLSPRNETDVRVANSLRIFENVPAVAENAAMRVMRGLTGGFSKKEYDLFNRVIVMRDFVRDIDKGLYPPNKELFFGYPNGEAVKADLQKFEMVVQKNPSVAMALEKRNEFFDLVKKDLIKYDLVPQEELTDPDYFHRQTLYYLNQKQHLGLGIRPKDVRLRKKGFQKERKPQALPKDYNTQYLEAEYEVIAHFVAQVETAKNIQRLKGIADISDAVKKSAKEKGMDWKEHFKQLRDEGLLEGFQIWKVNPGMNLFSTMTLPERVLRQVLEKSIPIEEVPFQQILMVGKNTEWVIPKNIAEAFEKVRPTHEGYYLGRASSRLLTTWKKWRLLNPFSVIKYNLNNLSGDLDIAIAYNPKILAYMKGAAKDLANFTLRKKMPDTESGLRGPDELVEAMKLGVLESGWTAQEIPDVGKTNVFSHLTGEKPNIIQRWWSSTSDFTNYREAILRLAAYRFFNKELDKGKRLYGASKKSEIDALRGKVPQKEMAAKLSRELIGDYGNISRAGQWIRSSLAPFWSFQEINMPRYFRLLKNLGSEGKSLAAGNIAGTVAVGGLRLSFKAAKLFVFANLLHGMVQIWNNTIYPDEERQLSPDQRRRGHLIVGKTGEGKIRTLRFQGALGEALDWFGMEDLKQDVEEVVKGQKTISEKITDIPKSILRKAVGVSRPEPKLLFESLTESSMWPDPLSPKPIRDIGEHIAQTVALESIYRAVSGKPTAGIQEDLKRLLFYDVDPGESAYWTVRTMAAEFMEKQGKGKLIPRPTKRSNAMYYYRQALKLKDLAAAEKYWKQYKDLGGTEKGWKISVRNLHPIGSLPRSYRMQFRASLDESQKEVLDIAITWWRSVYGN